ncbi:MAG: methionyl-tRNA formyltransferase [bacterium]|nr:methionyl-tRNA formyltransferase [bacterium]
MTKLRKKDDFLPRSYLGRNDVKFAFFGTSHIAVFVLDELKKAGLIPSLIVTTPDKPKGRGLVLQASPVKEWAQVSNIEILQPEKLDDEFCYTLKARRYTLDVCIVVDYGKLLPKEILAIPKRGFLNVHPSLLPRLRGPSPIRSAILNDEKTTGVSIVLVDEEMDHGPIVAQKRIAVEEWFNTPKRGEGGPHLAELEELLMSEGGHLLAQVLPQWVSGELEAHEQNHDVATYSEKIEKEDGLINLADDPQLNLRKIRAYDGWPGTYCYFERAEKRIRIGIVDAHIENGSLVIDKVKPEGKKEMAYEEFLRSGATPI